SVPLHSLHAAAPPAALPLSLHDALPISTLRAAGVLDRPSYRSLFVGFQFLRRLEHRMRLAQGRAVSVLPDSPEALDELAAAMGRSEEHTSELQSLTNLVCPLLLAKKKPP